MKTPMQELIDSVGRMAQPLDADELYDYFMEKATQMLEKEKEVIMEISKNSYIEGYLDNQSKVDDSMNFPQDYYNEIFNPKER